MYYVLRYWERGGRANTMAVRYGMCTWPNHGLWINHLGYSALSSKNNTNRAWLCTWLLGVCTQNFSKHLYRGFKPLFWKEVIICDNFLIWNYDRQAYNKVKIKNSLSKSPSKVKFLLINYVLPTFLKWTWCSIMSYPVWGTFHTNVDWLPRRLHCCSGQAPVSISLSAKRTGTHGVGSRVRCWGSRSYRSSLIEEIWSELSSLSAPPSAAKVCEFKWKNLQF